MADILSKRIERVSESILSNEAFTAQFEDDAANLLLNWALKSVEFIVSDTIGLNDASAEEAMYPRMKALRRIAKYAGKLAVGTDDPAELVGKIIEKAHDLYGPGFIAPDELAQNAFIQQVQSNPPTELVNQLIIFLQGEKSEGSV